MGGGAADPDAAIVALFGVSDRGGVYDIGAAPRLFQLSGGATAITPGAPVGYVSDIGPLAKPAIQATAGNRPLWTGIPRTLGAEVATNGRFATDTGWTKGAGWTIASNKASKSAGTASLLSQTAALVSGQAYQVFYAVECTAGAVTLQFTGGTTVSGIARSASGSYSEVLVAATGNTTVAFSGDSSFAGAVKLVSVRPVSLFVNQGACFDGVSAMLQTAAIDFSNTDKATIVFAGVYPEEVTSRIAYEIGNYYGSITGSVAGLYISTTPNALLRGDTAHVGVAASGEGSAGSSQVQHLNVVEVDIAQVSTAAELKLSARGIVPTLTPTGVSAGGGNMVNGAITLGAAAGSFLYWKNLIQKFAVINRTLTSGEKATFAAWAKRGMAYCAVLGDSTTALNDPGMGLSHATSTASLTGGMIVGAANVATAGDYIAGQKSKWNGLSDKSALQAVFIQIGLNDLRARVGENTATTAQVISDLQDLVDTVRAAIPAGCKIYIVQMTPCKAWLNGATNGAAAYAAWQAVNIAIAGGGGTPITGVDARITSHVAALNDGSDNLLAIYDHNLDGVHPSNEARFINAQAWRAQLEADSLV